MIIPAIDLIDGAVVRLYQGDYAQQTQYQFDPVETVKKYADAGAQCLHIVDLTGAKDTSKRQLSLIEKMVADKRMIIQAGGGIRSRQEVEQLLELGVDRVVVGSMAVSNTAEVKQWMVDFGAEHIVLALDVNIDEQGKRQIATHGWQQNSGVELESILAEFASVNARHILCTDISRDGTLQGANGQLYQAMSEQFPQLAWQASGGIGSLSDIEALKPTGVQGVILGRALLEGKFTLEEALACWQNG